jgi:beta-catenin-like protein 1
VVSIIASMLRNCRGPQRQRLLSKFTENDHEKVDRLLELHFKYLEKVEEVDLEIDRDRRVSCAFVLNKSVEYICMYTHCSLDCI